MDYGLKNKVIMVAASSRGLGRGIAESVAASGAHVSMASRTAEEITAAAADVSGKHGVRAKGFVMDATVGASIIAWAKATREHFGRIDGLVVNAGGPKPGKFDDFDDAAWQAGFELTLMSAVRMIRAVLPTMREQGSGSIVTITSSSIKEPIDILLLSNVFRSGVVSLVKSLSADLAADGIRINNLVPGMVDTDRIQSNDAYKAESLGIPVEEHTRKRQEAIPMGRYGTTREFGDAGAFLLSDAASYITGATLMVDGGKSRTVW
jgi:3-oxoacyl-[acyl-carrier protein] reductase